MDTPSQPGGGPPDLGRRGTVRQNIAAVGGALTGLILSEVAAEALPTGSVGLQFLGLGALVLLQIGWSYAARSRGRATPLLVFCEAMVAFWLGRTLADGFQRR